MNLLFHFPLDGHLGHPQFGGFINKMAMTDHMQVIDWKPLITLQVIKRFHFSWVKPMSRIFGSYGICMFNLYELAELFFQSGYTPSPTVCESSVCSTSSPSLSIVSFLNFRHSGRWVVMSLCGFNLHLPNDQMLSIFSYAFWPFICLLLLSVQSNFCSFLWAFYFLSCRFLIYSGHKSFICVLWIFSPSFHVLTLPFEE